MNNEFFNPLAKAKDTIFGIPKQIGDATSSIFANIFKNVDAPSPIVKAPGDGTPRNPFYQVTANDTGLDSVALNTGVALPDLVTANNGMRTLPPVGSYIATQPEAAQNPDMFQAQSRGYLPTSQPSINQPSDLYGSRREAKGNPVSPAMIARDEVNTSFGAFNEAYRLTGQVDTSLLPTSINIATVKALEAKGFFASGVDAEGNPLTPAEALQQYGYQFKDGQFVQSGAPGSQQNNDKPALGTREGQVMDSKFVLIRKGNKLVWQNMNKKNAEPDVKRKKKAWANNATTQQTTLDTKIGSG